MATPTLKRFLTSWEVMNSNLKAKLEEFPHLADDQKAFEQIVAEGVELEAEQGLHTTALRKTNQHRAELMERGTALYERLVAGLQHKFGAESRDLYTFGLRPKIARRRKKATAEEKKAKAKGTQTAAEPQEPSPPAKPAPGFEVPPTP